MARTSAASGPRRVTAWHAGRSSARGSDQARREYAHAAAEYARSAGCSLVKAAPQLTAQDFARSGGAAGRAADGPLHAVVRPRRRELRPYGARTCSLLRSLWLFLSEGGVELDRGTDERLECACVHFLPFMDVDRAPGVAVEARIEELARGVLRGPLGEGQLDPVLVDLAGADDPAVGPHGDPEHRVRRLSPFHLFHDRRVRIVDELAHQAQSLTAPVRELCDPLVDQIGRRSILGRTRLFHVLLLRERYPVVDLTLRLSRAWKRERGGRWKASAAAGGSARAKPRPWGPFRLPDVPRASFPLRRAAMPSACDHGQNAHRIAG